MTKLPVHVGIVSESKRVPMEVLAPVAAAMQQQVQRDFAPMWGVNAVIAAFPDRKSAQGMGYWPIVVQDALDDPGALGYHTDEHHQPYALVEATRDWTVTVSHELLEMLADPFGNRLWVAHDPKLGSGSQVRLLIEVCDPCEAVTYSIGGVEVSDFVTPAYYHTVHRIGSHYTNCGSIGVPRTLLQGGYISYVDADGHWWQQTWFGGSQPSTKELGKLADFAEPGDSLRQAIDRATPKQGRR
jgi:hypothetical protein